MNILVVIDMQNDFITGALGSPEAAAIVPAVVQKVQAYVADGHLVIFTQDTHLPGYLTTQEGRNLPVEHCMEHSDGWSLHPQLAPYADNVVRKSAFGSLDLANVISQIANGRAVDKIELVGLCTDICVVSNAIILKAAMTEVPISVDASCCAGTSVANHMAALTTMKCCQIEVK